MRVEPRSSMAFGASAIVLVLAAAMARPQATSDEKQPSNAGDQEAAWKSLRSMVGTWTSGADDGGDRTVQTYKLILQDKYLHVQTVSTTATDRHEDWEILSYDQGRDKVVLRQFVSEGYVNRFVLDEIKPDGKTFVFLSEASENAPPGFALRQTLRFDSERQITNELELAPPGQPFTKCAGGTLVRTSPAGEPAAPPRVLFDERTLDGWHAVGGGHWTVADGAIVGTSSRDVRAHGLLVTDAQFDDFEVTFEYLLTEGDSGFYFRVKETDDAVGVFGFQVEVDDVEPGGLYETGGRAWVVKPTPEEAATWHRSGAWNRVRLEAIGSRVRVWVNGTPTADLDDPEGRRRGHLALQLHGGQDMHVSFRDLRLREITTSP